MVLFVLVLFFKDLKYYEVLIESLRRKDYDDEIEKYYRDRLEKENGYFKFRKDRRKKEDDSIYVLMGGDLINRFKKDRYIMLLNKISFSFYCMFFVNY